eukprot:TRINITY_DN106151_c0_g1_i1.p1 TRINITY_DN106151_c0_g1~~TRINITY_DN106151_c0_g1_i1.p1  ORF type:complete len:721 (-),score=123.24 TRINITY_DN106151_c0_g1_i1:53-2215(-)
MGYRVGELAGPYEVLDLLGRGTFGEVLLAKDQHRRRVALKTVSCDQLSDEAAAGKVQDTALSEARLLMQLKHPHIVRCYEAQLDAARHVVWLALELMDGGDVQSLIDARRQMEQPPFEAHFVRRVLACVGSALEYVHAQGVLHRDCKPANILLARNCQRIKLGDFGISKLLEATNKARTVVGTPYYLSPEIVSGQAYGPAADAWALGVCLFELAALQRPFEAGNPLALVRRICEEPPLDLPPDTPPDISRAILGLLDRDAIRRITLSQALGVSEAVAALATSLEPENSRISSPSNASGCEAPLPALPPLPPPPRSQDVSPVSMATSVSGVNSPSEVGATADIVATLCGWGHGSSNQSPCSEAIARARLALSADIDDPEELQVALLALEQEAPEPGEPMHEAFEALSCELRIRLRALRADAAALLRSLLECPSGEGQLSSVGERTAFPLPAHWVPLRRDPVADTVTTLCQAEEEQGDVAALESAIELATSLGMDTRPAEEAASARGLLSVRVYCGSVSCFMLFSFGISFRAILAGVAKRFGFQDPTGGRPPASGGGASLFELWHREGSEYVHICDQTSWEELCRRRSPSRPGRLELELQAVAGYQPKLRRRVRGPAGLPQAPFVVTGTRLFLPNSSKEGKAFLCPPPSSWTGKTPRKEVRRSTAIPTPVRSSRPCPPREARAGRLPHRRRGFTPSKERCCPPSVPEVPLQLEGHAARRSSW